MKRPSLVCILASFLLVSLASRLAFAAGAIRIPEQLLSQLEAGQGFDSLLYSPKNSPFDPLVLGKDLKEDAVNVGKTEALRIEVRHRQEVFRFMSAGVEGSYQWMTGSVGGSFSKVGTEANSSESYHLLVRVAVRSSRITPTRVPSLSAKARELLNKGPGYFVQTYGDHYVYSVEKGGTLYILVKISSVQGDSSDEIKASLNLSTPAVDVSGFFQELKKKTESRYSVEYHIAWNGQVRTIPALGELEAFINGFPTLVSQQPAYTQFEAFPLLEHPEIVARYAKKDFEVFSRRRVVDRLYRELEKTELTVADLHVVKNSNQGMIFRTLAGKHLLAINGAIAAAETRRDWIRDAVDDVVANVTLPKIEQMPPLRETPFVVQRVLLPAQKLEQAAPNTRYDEKSDHPEHWPEHTIAWQTRLFVRDSALYFQGGGDWEHERDYAFFLRLSWHTGDRHLMPLPPATYYLLPDGSNDMRDVLVDRATGPNGRYDFGGTSVIAGGSREGTSRTVFRLRPVRVLCLTFAQEQPSAQGISSAAAKGN